MTHRRGLTLLEVMVALVILGLVATAVLEVFGGSVRAAGSSREWSQAVVYAEEAMERTKLIGSVSDAGMVSAPEPLAGGFERWVETDAWTAGVRMVTVVVAFPAGGKFELSRLVRAP
jgi:type II secretion system protein I